MTCWPWTLRRRPAGVQAAMRRAERDERPPRGKGRGCRGEENRARTARCPSGCGRSRQRARRREEPTRAVEARVHATPRMGPPRYWPKKQRGRRQRDPTATSADRKAKRIRPEFSRAAKRRRLVGLRCAQPTLRATGSVAPSPGRRHASATWPLAFAAFSPTDGLPPKTPEQGVTGSLHPRGRVPCGHSAVADRFSRIAHRCLGRAARGT